MGRCYVLAHRSMTRRPFAQSQHAQFYGHYAPPLNDFVLVSLENLSDTLWLRVEMNAFHAQTCEQDVTEHRQQRCGCHAQQHATKSTLTVLFVRMPPMPGYLCHVGLQQLDNRPGDCLLGMTRKMGDRAYLD